MNQYIAGDLVAVSATFTNAANAAADPSVVTLKVGRKDSAPSVSTYTSGTLTGPYSITKTATGAYTANIDTTGFAQAQWTYEWIGTGTVQTVNYGTFAITTPPL